MIFAGDFNMNMLESATPIDYIITAFVLTCGGFKTSILKTDLTYHFPIVIALKNHGPSQQHSKTKHNYKRSYNEENIKVFNHRLLSINWDEIKNCNDSSEAYKQFFNRFNLINDMYFPKVFVGLNSKSLDNKRDCQIFLKETKTLRKISETSNSRD